MKPMPRRKDTRSWKARGPLSKRKQIKELTKEEIEDIEEGVADIKAGRVYTSEQVRTKLGL